MCFKFQNFVACVDVDRHIGPVQLLRQAGLAIFGGSERDQRLPHHAHAHLGRLPQLGELCSQINLMLMNVYANRKE